MLKTMTLKDKPKKKMTAKPVKKAKSITTSKAMSTTGAQASGTKKKRMNAVASIAKAK